MALKTKFAPFLMSVSRKVYGAGGSGVASSSVASSSGASSRARARHSRTCMRMLRNSRRTRASRAARCRSLRARRAGGPGYVLGELFCVGLYGWLELRNTVYTLSTLLSFSKNGIKSNSSESVMSSNHDATGTALSGWNM